MIRNYFSWKAGALALLIAGVSCGNDTTNLGNNRNDPKDPQETEQNDISLEDTLNEAQDLGLVEGTLLNSDNFDFAAYDLNLIPELNLTLEDAFLKTREVAYRNNPRFKKVDYSIFAAEYAANQELRNGFYQAMNALTDQEKAKLDAAVNVWANQQKLEVSDLGLGVLPARDGTAYVVLLTKMVTEDNQEIIGYKLQRYDADNSTGLQIFMDKFHDALGGSLGYFGKDPFRKYALNQTTESKKA